MSTLKLTDPKTIPYEPKFDNLLLLPVQAAEKVGQIIIPESHRRPLSQGVILKRGPSCSGLDRSTEIGDMVTKIGEVVIFPLHAEQQISWQRNKYYIIKESDILLGGVTEEELNNMEEI